MQPTRRGLLRLAGAAIAAPSAKVEETSAIGPQPRHYLGWPTLARTKAGGLLAVYSGGREQHVCPFGRVELVRSSDNGRTWSWPQVVMDTPIDDRDAGIVETPRGTLLVTTFTSLAYERLRSEAKDWDADRLARWDSVNRATTPQQREALLGAWMLRSTDGGLTWSQPYRVPMNSPHGPVVLDDDRLFYSGKVFPKDGRIGVWASSDDGISWDLLGWIPTRPGDTYENYHELHGIDAGGGRLIVQIRNHNTANQGETLQTESADGGKSWSVPHAIGVWGLPSHLLRLKDGRLLMTYGYRRSPRGNQARVSEDRGRTWSEPIVISDDGAGDLGYPSTVELASGELLTLWYEARKNERHVSDLRLARWRLTA
jgi:Neuraminidase (sialidase)